MVAAICFHSSVNVGTNVNKLEDRSPPVFLLEIEVKCAACGARFQFEGLPRGVSLTRPACSVDQLEATLPMSVSVPA